MKVTPTCTASHDPMQRVPGMFARPGGAVKEIEVTGLLNTVGNLDNANGEFFGVRTWRCGRIDLFDDEAP